MTALDLTIDNRIHAPIRESVLRHAAEAVLAHLKVDAPVEATLVITDDAQVRGLNRQFRGIDAPTDILSFPAEEHSPGLPTGTRYLGDMILAFPYAVEQARREGHPLDDSLSLLVVHSLLHLLGYNHDSAKSRAEMWRIQDAVLMNLGISPALVPALEQAEQHE